MSQPDRSRRTHRRLVVIALLAFAFVGIVFADETRCFNCGKCSSSEFGCGMCVFTAVGSCCSSYTPDAFAICDGGEWFAFCDGHGGGMTSCGVLAE
ncbi:MAG: hypothetical protein Q7V01_06785 [Vicinamibacterales bacterium]|nr:hypothetical protein [Vicinamibacterales bacterium]